ncbi:related to Cutl1 or CASP protein [Melanopsichium pennsylvanicum]|uniref:Protein CASP n=1 Tax=Melanopsichium pennsylvanicum TaxID=63383 RepID=A0AAJ4XMQ7_9BASI|nr:related to Cutl1 or CASP protein [Melanopsichium pennsylvanicum]
MDTSSTATPNTIVGSNPNPNLNRSAFDFSAALSIWRDINLVDLQQQLNTIAPELVESQKAAVSNRKKLADQTREFKKQPDSNKLESFKLLLKAYQAEIDTLTKRSKTAENAFLNVHSALTTAPDPYPFLEVTLEQAASLNDLESLKHDNAKLNKQLALHSAQAQAQRALQAENAHLQHTIHSLEHDFQLKLQQSTSALELELEAKWDERIRNLNQRQADLTNSLNLAQEQLRHFKSKDETATAQLLQKRYPDDDDDGDGDENNHRDGNPNSAEFDLLCRDLERAHARVETVEKRNEQLRVEIESVKSGRHESDKLQKLQADTQEKDRKLNQIQSLLQSERQTSADLSTQLTSAKHEKLKLETEKDQEIESLRNKLQQRSDYAHIKRELEIVKAVHFNADDDEENTTQASLASVAANADDEHRHSISSNNKLKDGKTLEALLLAKNKRLEDELANLRVSNGELSASLEKAATDLDSLNREKTRLESLNEKIELDLVSMGRERRSSISRGDSVMSAQEALKEIESLEAQVTRVNQNAKLGNDKLIAIQKDGTVTNPTRSLTISASGKRSTCTNAASVAGLGGEGDSSILSIVTSQRDRFRSRNAELEQELGKQFETISELRVEIKTLQCDNLGLYEKVRYLQSYANGVSSRGDSMIQIGTVDFNSSSSSRGGVGMGRRIDVLGDYPPSLGGDDDDKYYVKYEESMNPFQAFRGREKSRGMAQLNPFERVLHVFTSLVLRHRRMRLFFMVYAIGLHLLIFGMIFQVSNISSVQTCSIPQPN